MIKIFSVNVLVGGVFSYWFLKGPTYGIIVLTPCTIWDFGLYLYNVMYIYQYDIHPIRLIV